MIDLSATIKVNLPLRFRSRLLHFIFFYLANDTPLQELTGIRQVYGRNNQAQNTIKSEKRYSAAHWPARLVLPNLTQNRQAVPSQLTREMNEWIKHYYQHGLWQDKLCKFCLMDYKVEAFSCHTY